MVKLGMDPSPGLASADVAKSLCRGGKCSTLVFYGLLPEDKIGPATGNGATSVHLQSKA